MKALLTLVMAVVLAPVFANAEDTKATDATAPAATSEEVKKDDAKDTTAK
jgi:hypothetical protein